MGQARTVMDKITEALTAGDVEGLKRLYARDVVADTPDEGRLEGRDAVVDWLIKFNDAFSDMSFELTATLEAGDTAIDEAYLSATHTGPIAGPEGDIPPTGKRIRMRECDVATVRDGVVVSHRFYFDQLDFMIQLGVVQPDTIVLPDAQPVSMSTGAGAH